MTFPADYSVFEVGNVTFPIAETSENGLLRDADPCVFFALDYYAAMLAQHLGARFVADCATAGVLAGNGIAISAPVMTAVPYDVTAYLGTVQYQFPILAISRKSITSEWKEFGFERDVSKIAIQYVLPPLSAAQAEAIVPILSAVFKVLRAKTSQGQDPSYAPPGGQPNDMVWHSAYANAEEMGIDSAKVGELEGEGNLHFPTLLLEASFIERDNPPTNANLATFTGLDATVGQLDDNGSTSLSTPALVIGTADTTQASLYGTGGSLDGLTIILNVNGGGALTLTLSGSGNAASEAALLAAITVKWSALAAANGGTHGWLVLTDSVLGSSSTIVVGSGTANALLGLTPGTTTGAAGLEPIAQVSTQPAPTLTSVSPSIGTQAGGTAVTLTGTGFATAWQASGFRDSPRVLVGNSLATSVVVVSATSITCVTPAALGNGTVSVTVFNGDSQFGNLASSFTYTTP
jgi:hypothetical protein